MNYKTLLALFKDDNFNDIIRHIKLNLNQCHTKREKIDMASSLIFGNLRKLNLQNKKSEMLQDSQYSSNLGSRKSFMSKKSILSQSPTLSIANSRRDSINSRNRRQMVNASPPVRIRSIKKSFFKTRRTESLGIDDSLEVPT